MILRTIDFYILFLFIAFMSACGQTESDDTSNTNKSTKESLIKVNRYLTKTENEDIERFIKRHKWEMEETGSGLRYMIFEEGSGPMATKNQVVELEYELSLITGDVVYSSADNGPQVFKIGHGGVETGLEEALLLMKKGDRAKLVIPSHLAHGFLGDDNKIPPRSTVIYDIKIINLK